MTRPSMMQIQMLAASLLLHHLTQRWREGRISARHASQAEATYGDGVVMPLAIGGPAGLNLQPDRYGKISISLVDFAVVSSDLAALIALCRGRVWCETGAATGRV
ncbi:hypothetical protein ACFIOY_00410 [Bradyrhizobium sp. TZ2]